MSEKKVDAVFAALSDPTRRRVLRAVASAGQVTATQLSADFPVSRQAVTKHLKELSDAGLVTTHRQGRDVFYALSPAPLTDAVDWLTDVGAEWDDRLESLQTYLGKRRR